MDPLHAVSLLTKYWVIAAKVLNHCWKGTDFMLRKYWIYAEKVLNPCWKVTEPLLKRHWIVAVTVLNCCWKSTEFLLFSEKWLECSNFRQISELDFFAEKILKVCLNFYWFFCSAIAEICLECSNFNRISDIGIRKNSENIQ